MLKKQLFNRQEKILLGVLAFINFSHIVDFMIVMPMGPRLMRTFNISPHQLGVLLSSYSFSAAAMAIVISFFVDRFDRKKNLLVFYIGFCTSTVACAFSPSYHFLLLSRLLSGAFGGMLGSMILAIVGDSINAERRGSAFGIITLALSMASVVGVPFSLFLANKFDWHAPFLFLGCISFLLTFAIIFFVPPITKHLEEPHLTSPVQDFFSVVKNSNQLKAMFFMFCLVLGQFSIVPYISAALVANAGVLETQLQYVYLVAGCFTFFTAPIIGRLADRYGKRNVFYYSLAISMIPIYMITHQGVAPLFVIIPFSTLLFVSLGGRMIPAMALITSTVNPQHRGTFMSLNSSVMQLSSALATFIGGLILIKNVGGRLENYDLVGIFSMVFSLIAGYLIRTVKVIEFGGN